MKYTIPLVVLLMILGLILGTTFEWYHYIGGLTAMYTWPVNIADALSTDYMNIPEVLLKEYGDEVGVSELGIVSVYSPFLLLICWISIKWSRR